MSCLYIEDGKDTPTIHAMLASVPLFSTVNILIVHGSCHDIWHHVSQVIPGDAFAAAHPDITCSRV